MFLMMKPICRVVYLQRTAGWQVPLSLQLCKNNEFCINSKTAGVNYLLISYNDSVRTGLDTVRTCCKTSYCLVLVTNCKRGV